LEELDRMYVLHVVPWKSSQWVAPTHDMLDTTTEPITGDASTNGAPLAQTESERRKRGEVAPEAGHSESV